MLFFSPYDWLLLPAIALALYAQFKVKSTYERYSRVRAAAGLTGAQVAAHMLQANGIRDVNVEETGGMLSDHYDPRKKVLRLSSGVYHSDSIAAVGVAAHEAGHAAQHASGYLPLRLSSGLEVLPQAQHRALGELWLHSGNSPLLGRSGVRRPTPDGSGHSAFLRCRPLSGGHPAGGTQRQPSGSGPAAVGALLARRRGKWRAAGAERGSVDLHSRHGGGSSALAAPVDAAQLARLRSDTDVAARPLSSHLCFSFSAGRAQPCFRRYPPVLSDRRLPKLPRTCHF